MLSSAEDRDKVYPPVFYELYADITDILYIGSRDAAYEFINGERCYDMKEEMLELLSFVDSASFGYIEDMAEDLIERVRLHHEEMFNGSNAPHAVMNDDMDDGDMDSIVVSLQEYMPQICTVILEALMGLEEEDRPIQWSDCRPAPKV
ncbi:MAG: hypothetical protein WC989_01440 [Micavibrio sp.]